MLDGVHREISRSVISVLLPMVKDVEKCVGCGWSNPLFRCIVRCFDEPITHHDELVSGGLEGAQKPSQDLAIGLPLQGVGVSEVHSHQKQR